MIMIELLQKETPEFILLQLWPQICQIWIQLMTTCWDYCKRRWTKYASWIWMNYNRSWEWSGPSWIMWSLRQPFVSGSRSMFLFCTPSVAIL